MILRMALVLSILYGMMVCLSLVVAFLKFSLPQVREGAKVYDETGTEVDEDVFADIVQQPDTGILTIKFDDGEIAPY